MTTLRRILAGIGGGDAAAVVDRAAALAGATGSALRCVACVYDAHLAGERFADSPELERSRTALVDDRRAALTELVRPLGGRGIDVSVAARWAYPPYEGLITEAREFQADLMVTTSSRPSAGRQGALTHTDWELIRHTPCPVLVGRAAPAGGYREIVVAVDPVHAHDEPAALDDRLIGLGLALARAFGARLRLLHCYLPAEYVPLRAPGAFRAGSHGHRPGSIEAHRDALQQLARGHGIPESDIVLELADPREAIPEVANRLGADLVVIGAIARSRLRRLLVGSTTEHVLDRLACDFLAVKPPVA